MATKQRHQLYIWITGSFLSASLLMILSLLLLVTVKGLSAFWPVAVVHYVLDEKIEMLGLEISSDSNRERGEHVKIKRGNRDIFDSDFIWLETKKIRKRSFPETAMVVQRLEWGDFIGFPVHLIANEQKTLSSDDSFYRTLDRELLKSKEIQDRVNSIEEEEVATINREKESLAQKLLHAPANSQLDRIKNRQMSLDVSYERHQKELQKLKKSLSATLVLETVDRNRVEIPLRNIVSVLRPNNLGIPGKTFTFLQNLWMFVSEEPREANTEGGVFPALMGTVMMVFIMTVIVTPFGVLAAIYLHEYARPGIFVNAIRVAVNNLAGVPSIVFGVFGVGFFIYGIGAGIDQLFFSENLPRPTFGTGGILWASLTLALLTLPTVIVATEEGLAAIPKHYRDAAYALGATRFEMIRRVIIPSLLPAIMTGIVLAIARAAGEVAPLMITGVVKLAPALAVDGEFPYIHLQRKFMHLGFHIYDLGFQSPNVDAARPFVFATTLLLIVLVVVLNMIAIIVRKRFRKRLGEGAFT